MTFASDQEVEQLSQRSEACRDLQRLYVRAKAEVGRAQATPDVPSMAEAVARDTLARLISATNAIKDRGWPWLAAHILQEAVAQGSLAAAEALSEELRSMRSVA